MKGYVKESSNSLDSNRERVAFSIFLVDLIFSNQGKMTTTTTKKCSDKCMKKEPNEVKTEQSIKTGFNFTSQRFSNKWRNFLVNIET